MGSLLFLLGSFFSLWVVAAWVMGAFFAGHVAAEKSRCGFCWFVWGLLFGPLALLATVGLPDNRPVKLPLSRAEQAEAAQDRTEAIEGIGRNVGRMVQEPKTWVLVLLGGAALIYALNRPWSGL